jgi:YegS/Rv2252/BmrU family lipid kinase
MRVTVIFNSKVKKRNLVYENLLKLESSNVATKLTILETEYVGHGIELAKEASFHSDCIVAAGGDGTVNETVNGIMLSGLPKEQRPILAHFPCGSANDYSRTVQISKNIDDLINLIRKQHTHPIDIGEVHYSDEEGNNKSRYFVNILDCGIGAEVVKRVNSSTKILGVNFTFLRAITSAFFTYQKSTVICKTDGEEFSEKVLTQVFAIGKYFGSGIYIAPDAKPDNGYFQSVTIGDISFSEYARYLRKLKKSQRISHPKLWYRKCISAELTPQEYSCSVEMDGEFLGYAPIKVEMKMHELKLLCDQFPKE